MVGIEHGQLESWNSSRLACINYQHTTRTYCYMQQTELTKHFHGLELRNNSTI